MRAMAASAETAGARQGTSPAAPALGRDLGRLAWAGACDALVDGTNRAGGGGPPGCWVAVPGTQVPEGTTVPALSPRRGPDLRALSAWERMLPTTGPRA